MKFKSLAQPAETAFPLFFKASAALFRQVSTARLSKLARFLRPATIVTPLVFRASAAFADGSNPFDLTTSVATSWQGYAKTAAIAIAGLAGTVVIILGMFGVLRLRWAFQIGGGLIALTGLAWVISALQGTGG